VETKTLRFLQVLVFLNGFIIFLVLIGHFNSNVLKKDLNNDKHYKYMVHLELVWYSSTSLVKLFFLENSFMSDFIDEVKLFWKKCLAK